MRAKAVRIYRLWIPSPSGILKFNVDESVISKSGPIGIDGVLRNYSTAVKIVFFKAIDVADSNVVKLLAVREAIRLFTSSSWVNSHKLVIESDSSNVNVVKWIHNPHSIP